jgi:uncharacterized membrane protein YfcA
VTAVVICLTALAASALTFFSGFGLGTLLLPAFALFYPIEVAVASTAIVHFLNGLFKLVLVGRHADLPTVVRFGLPAIAAAFVGAWLLVRLAGTAPIASYSILGFEGSILPAKFTVGVLLLLVTALELTPRYEKLALPSRYVPLGGFLSGLFGGLSGMQGALRSAFLIRLGLSKEAFIGTGVVVATLVDMSRLGVYAKGLASQRAQLDYDLLGAAVLSAFLGAVIGNRFLRRLTIQALQRIVGVLLILVALGLVAGIL